MDETTIKSANYDYETSVRYLEAASTLASKDECSHAIDQLIDVVASLLNKVQNSGQIGNHS